MFLERNIIGLNSLPNSNNAIDRNKSADALHTAKLEENNSAYKPVDMVVRFGRSAIGNTIGKPGEINWRKGGRLALGLGTLGFYPAAKIAQETFSPNAKGLYNQTVGQGSAVAGHAWHRLAYPVASNTVGAGFDAVHMGAQTSLGVVNTAASISGKIGQIAGFVPRAVTAPISLVTGWDTPDAAMKGVQDSLKNWSGNRWIAAKGRYSEIPSDVGNIVKRTKNVGTTIPEGVSRAGLSAIPFAGPTLDRTIGENAISYGMKHVRDSQPTERIFGQKGDKVLLKNYETGEQTEVSYAQKYNAKTQIPKNGYEPEINNPPKKDNVVSMEEYRRLQQQLESTQAELAQRRNNESPDAYTA